MKITNLSTSAPAGKARIEEELFFFLRSVSAGRPQAPRPLLPERDALRALYQDPHGDLVIALRHCLDAFLIELGPDAAGWGVLELTPHIWGLALAAYQCLTPAPATHDDTTDPTAEFAAALIATIPPARTLPEALAYHALLHVTAAAVPHLAPTQANLMRSLLHRSPLSAVYHIQLETPRSLLALSNQLLFGTKRRALPITPWRSLDDWLEALVGLLAQRSIAAFLQQRWLALPESRSACRNLGLLLETLRARGNRDFLLRFYESYDYFQAEPDMATGLVRTWPLLGRIERLLRIDGDSAAVIELNRRGHEFLLKFYPLIQLVIAEDGVPRDYRFLSREFVLNLKHLWKWTAYPSPGASSRRKAAEVQFVSEGA